MTFAYILANSVVHSERIVASAPAQIVLVDPHPLAREGLRINLERRSNIHVVAEAGDGAAGLYAAARHQESILVANVQLPDMQVAELLARFHAEPNRGPGVIVCQVPSNAALIRRLLDSYVTAFVGQNAGPGEYLAAIEAVLCGGVFMSANLFECIVADRNAGAARANPYRLTDRELEVLQMLSNGLSNKEVANLLNLSVRTVEAHRFTIRQKTGANMLSELFRIARSLQGEAEETVGDALPSAAPQARFAGFGKAARPVEAASSLFSKGK
jgi:DNA-binding NarL/FixJ family response regulator